MPTQWAANELLWVFRPAPLELFDQNNDSRDTIDFKEFDVYKHINLPTCECSQMTNEPRGKWLTQSQPSARIYCR